MAVADNSRFGNEVKWPPGVGPAEQPHFVFSFFSFFVATFLSEAPQAAVPGRWRQGVWPLQAGRVDFFCFLL